MNGTRSNYKGNPEAFTKVPKRPKKEIERLFMSFELLVRRIGFLRKVKLIETNPSFNVSDKKLSISKEQIDKCYEKSMQWVINRFNYHPKFIRNHFHEFFQDAIAF